MAQQFIGNARLGLADDSVALASRKVGVARIVHDLFFQPNCEITA
jgi:hypothetical protein